MSSAAAAGNRAFGLDRGLPFPLEDIPRTGCVILVGSNLAETMPPALRYLTELRENGGTLIVVDPRRTRTAEQADLHLRPAPGHRPRARARPAAPGRRRGAGRRGVHPGAYDAAGRRRGRPRWRTGRSTSSGSPGCPLPQLREAVRMFCEPETAMVLTARGPEQHVQGHRHGGRLDQPVPGHRACRAGRCPATAASPGRATGRAGANTARRPTSCPATASSTDPAARAHVAEVWGVDPDALPGPGAAPYELLDALGTRHHAPCC